MLTGTMNRPDPISNSSIRLGKGRLIGGPNGRYLWSSWPFTIREESLYLGLCNDHFELSYGSRSTNLELAHTGDMRLSADLRFFYLA